MSWLRTWDLYKAIIFGSLLLLPAVGGWAWWLQQQIEQGRVAIANAVKDRGDLQEIGGLQKEVEEQKRSRDSETPLDFNTYFQRWIVKGAGGIQAADFHVDNLGDSPVQRKAIDKLVGVQFKRQGKALPLGRDALLAVLFNLEAQSPIWKLRGLQIVNPGVKRVGGSAKVPPPELADEWEVREMVFASRRPIGAAK